jgi:hypothetical protein
VRQRLAQQRQDLRAVVGDREALEAEVGLARRDVVVGVVRPGDEVRGADRLAQIAQPEPPTRVEEVAHDRVALRRGGQQRGRGVRDRGAEALDPLERLARVDRDRPRQRRLDTG